MNPRYKNLVDPALSYVPDSKKIFFCQKMTLFSWQPPLYRASAKNNDMNLWIFFWLKLVHGHLRNCPRVKFEIKKLGLFPNAGPLCTVFHSMWWIVLMQQHAIHLTVSV